MKKFYFALLALAATLSFASCVQDPTDEGKDVTKVDDPNSISFVLSSGIQTRSAADVRTASYSLGDPVEGQHVYLEETVTSLDAAFAPEPETKGTPVYTDNFRVMSGGSFMGLAYAASDMTTPVVPDGAFPYVAEEGKWVRKFAENPYADQDEVYYFMRMPAAPAGLTNLAYNVIPQGQTNAGRCTIEFDYTVPLTATAQQDILFTGRPVAKSDGTNVPVIFHHALTGLKFATAHDNDTDVKTYITKVEFPRGIRSSAHFKIMPSWEGGQYEDNTETYSSASAVSTSNERNVDDDHVVLSQTFEEDDVVDYAAGSTGGAFTDKGNYPGSFVAGGSGENNLNDGNASMTFWLIPQKMTQNTVINVSFYIVSGGKRSETVTRTLEIGKLLLADDSSARWNAGELRTFTLRANEVDVVIEDEVEGLVKDEVKITNVGNAPSYIRAHIVGNWYGKGAGGEEGIAMGYVSDETDVDGNYVSEIHITPWALGEPASDGTIAGDNCGGVFDSLPGSGWILGNDGFFYYTLVVQPGTETAPLFRSFTCTSSIPTIYFEDALVVRHAFTDVHLALDIPVQAVEAKLVPGTTDTYEDYQTAWAAAGVTGITD